MKNYHFKIAIPSVSVLLITLYTYFLYICGSEIILWKPYIISTLIVCIFLATALLLYRFLHSKNKTVSYLTTFIFVILSLISTSYAYGSGFKQNCEILILSLFPMICYIIVEKAVQHNLNTTGLTIVYNIAIVALIWLFQEVVFKENYFAADIIAEAYMYVVAQTALIACLIKETDKRINAKTICCLVIINIAVLYLFLHQERVCEITSSFSNSFSSTDSEGYFTNWFAHRFSMLKNSIGGDFSSINIHHIRTLIKGCPVSYLSGVYGWHIGTAIVLLEGILVTLMLVHSKKNNNTFSLILALSFLVKALIGILANLFLIYSTNVGFPLISSAYDSIIILLFMATTECQKY